MTVISRRIATPLTGKTALTISRAKSLAEIMERAGGRARVRKVIFGDGTGDIHLYGSFTDFTIGTKAVTNAVYVGRIPNPSTAEPTATIEISGPAFQIAISSANTRPRLLAGILR